MSARASDPTYDLVPAKGVQSHRGTTAFTLDGYRIVRSLGVVRGIVVRSRSLIGNIGAAFQILVGGNISLYTRLCEQRREEAFQIMVHHAARLGANAVVGMRYAVTEIAACVTEVLAYGTGVLVEPAQGGPFR